MLTGIIVKTRFFPLSWFLLFCRPIIEIDGVRHLSRWGSSYYGLAPGMHQVRIYFSYFWMPECGINQLVVHLSKGQVRKINYDMPPWILAPGSIKIESPD